MRRALVPASILALTLACALPATAQAQTRDPAAAEAFFAEGRALLKQGRYPEACNKFESSQKLDPGNGTLMNLADCYEKSGRLASSWLAFREAAAAASSAGQAARAAHARARAATLEPRLCRLRVTVDPSVTAPVLRDGRPLDRSVWGEAVPVDPGRHTVVVRNGETVLFVRDVEVEPAASGSCDTQSIVVPAIASPAPAPAIANALAPAAPPAAGAPVATPASSAPAVAATPSATQQPRSPLPLVVAGVGVLAMGAGTYFGFRAKDEWSDAQSKCVAAGCGSDAQALAASARTDAGIGTVAFIGGSVLAVGGLVWWLVQPTSTSNVLVTGARF